MLYSVSHGPLEASLHRHLSSYFVQNVRLIEIEPDKKCYTYKETYSNEEIRAPGLISCLKNKFYNKYEERPTKRRRSTKRKGSNSKQGKEIDNQLASSFYKKPTHRMAIALVEYFTKLGQTIHACQVPVWVPSLGCITQSDVITIDKEGKLHLYEIKTGFPIGAYQSKTELRGPVKGIPNTKYNHWTLQLRFTQLGLEKAGMKFKTIQIAQICDYYEKKTKETTLKIKIHKMPDWALKLK